MEHLNRTLKSILSTRSHQQKATVKAARSIRTIHIICEVFKTTSDASTSDKHPYPAFTKDFNEVLGVLEDMKVFDPVEWNGCCSIFTIPTSPTSFLNILFYI